jgi:hypothetical protein
MAVVSFLGSYSISAVRSYNIDLDAILLASDAPVASPFLI